MNHDLLYDKASLSLLAYCMHAAGMTHPKRYDLVSKNVNRKLRKLKSRKDNK